jgi:hypothetical protein
MFLPVFILLLMPINVNGQPPLDAESSGRRLFVLPGRRNGEMATSIGENEKSSDLISERSGQKTEPLSWST